MYLRLIFINILLMASVGTFAQPDISLPINPGRQLFVDDALIEKSFNVEQKFHTPSYYSCNPVIVADKPWEFNINGDPYAAPFSGGVWFDELDGKYKMWYSAGGNKMLGLITCYAESYDGKSWIKPSLDVVPGTNIVDTLEHDCVSVLLDKHEQDSAKRFKMFVVEFNDRFSVSMRLKYSYDGIHWSHPKALSGELYDRCAAYYDPFRKKYILSLKTMNKKYGRARNFLECSDPETLVSLAHKVYEKDNDKFIRYWFHADEDDPRNPLFPDIQPQIYNHEAMPYESLMLGYFTIWQGPENEDCDSLMIQKRNEVLIGFSRDGFHWNRRFKKPFLPVDEDFHAWNAGNVQSVAGCPLIVGDSLYFYMSGRYNSKPKHDSNFATGLAMLRRDGFASLRTGETDGFVITVPLHVSGAFCFINAEINGRLYAELLDENSNVIDGFSKNDFKVINKVNSTKLQLQWKRGDLSSLIGRKVKIKFYMRAMDLYSFWFAQTEKGLSGGYTAGGGPSLSSSGIDK